MRRERGNSELKTNSKREKHRKESAPKEKKRGKDVREAREKLKGGKAQWWGV